MADDDTVSTIFVEYAYMHFYCVSLRVHVRLCVRACVCLSVCAVRVGRVEWKPISIRSSKEIDCYRNLRCF